jgi:hypothetical protein
MIVLVVIILSYSQWDSCFVIASFVKKRFIFHKNNKKDMNQIN